jgi:catechol 2,3-dioxygenase-like lactoylglutathione lyase family enzyme
MLTGFDHVTIVVRQLDAALETYRRLLGLAPVWRGTHPELGTEGALFALSNSLVELTAPLGAAEEAAGVRALLDARGEGLQAIAFATADAAACSTGWRARGLRATAPQDGEARSHDGSARHYRTVELSARSTRGLGVLAVERPAMTVLRASAAPPADAVDALDHIVLRTAAPDAAVALYGQGLGIRLALDRVLGRTRMLFFRIGGVTLEVVENPALNDSDAFYGVAYRVRNIDAAHARMQAGGLTLSEIRDGNKPGTRVYTVRDGTCSVPTLVLRDPSRDQARA